MNSRGVIGANFRNLVTTAVSQLGWKVEVWAWRSACHNVYHRLEQEYPGMVRVCLLDPFRLQVTFRHEVAAAEVTAAAAAAAGADEDEGEDSENAEIAVLDDEDDDLCVVCFASESTHALRPCGHKVLCEVCADEWSRPARGWMDIYIYI